MKKLLLIVILFVISLSVFSQDSNEKKIREILNAQTEAWNRGDLEHFMSGYWKSDSLMFIGKSGVTYGWTKTLDNYKKSYPDKTAMGILVFDILSVEKLSDQFYHVIGKWTLQRTIGDLKGHYTLLFKKIAGEWVIVADHSS